MATTKCDIRVDKGSFGKKFNLFKLEHGLGFVNRPVNRKRALAMGSTWDLVKTRDGDLVLLKNPKSPSEYLIIDGQHRIYGDYALDKPTKPGKLGA